MTVLDMSQARLHNLPKPIPVAEEPAAEKMSLLAQLFAIANQQMPADSAPAQIAAIEDFEMMGMRVALEYVAQQTDTAMHPGVVELRGQILTEQIKRFQAAELAAIGAEAEHNDQGQEPQ